MPFRGLDPDGLVDLAVTTVAATGRARNSVHPALSVLDRNGLADAAAALAGAGRRIDNWGAETADNLRWRADAVSAGQNTYFNVGALLRARFAAEAVFTSSNRDDAFQGWLSVWHRQEQRLAAAVSDIADWLSQGLLTNWDVTNGDLHNIRLTLEGLTANEMDRVIQRLTPSQLERWIAEMGHSINGFSSDEKRDVFAILAAHTSGTSLGRVHDAILEVGGEEELADFGRAIRAQSADEEIVEFVADALARDLTAHRFSTLAPALAIAGIDGDDAATTAASAIVNTDNALGVLTVDTLIHSNDGAVFDALVSILARGSSADRTVAFTTFASFTTNQQGVLADLIMDRRGRDQFDSQIEQHLDARLVDEARLHALDAATRMLEADPASTVMRLARDLDPHGSLTASYWHLMVEQEQAGSIASILRKLRGGEEVNLDMFCIAANDPSYRYPNARNMAFAAATLNRGFTSVADEAKGDIEAIGRVAGVALTVIGVFSGDAAVAEGLLGIGAGWSIGDHVTKVGADIDDQLATLIDRATTGLRPPDGADLTSLPDAGNAMLAWTTVYTRLLTNA